MLSSLNLGVETQKYFVSLSNMFLDKKTWLRIWLNPGLLKHLSRNSALAMESHQKNKGRRGSWQLMDFGKIKSKQEFIVG